MTTQASSASPLDIPVMGRWEHCCPDLLKAGIDCANTPRRPCECSFNGSHDHFISADRLEMESFDADGNRVQWSIGSTQDELLQAHNDGRCWAFCGYCVTEAEDLTTHNAI